MTSPAVTAQPTSVPEPRRYTPEEYLDRETNAAFRSEYDDGIITPMTGGTLNHNQISLNCSIALSLGLRGQDIRICMADMKVWVPKDRKFRYPDVMAIVGRPEFYGDSRSAITNPQVIIEVLSDATADFDRASKFLLYQSIPAFQEYILIDQYKTEIIQMMKTGPKQWNGFQYDEQDSELLVRSLNLSIPIADIYDKVEFETGPTV